MATYLLLMDESTEAQCMSFMHAVTKISSHNELHTLGIHCCKRLKTGMNVNTDCKQIIMLRDNEKPWEAI